MVDFHDSSRHYNSCPLLRVAGHNICKQRAGQRCGFTEAHVFLAQVQRSYASVWKAGLYRKEGLCTEKFKIEPISNSLFMYTNLGQEAVIT